ncbi:hypothetical protein AB0B89_23625 [Sphaerisporangium sp. NPDC049002]|uniref:hypothetical protein n=1 Tax=Sphaerisporangium sp. NPDC049002 TaxID=3155392 RepID=UPI0033F82650
MKRLVPYPVLAGDLSLEVREVRLDDVALPFAMISPANRVVALHQVERQNWETARLSLVLRVPRQELQSGRWSDTSCFAVLSERRTNVRAAARLREDASGSWVGEVVLYRDRHVARADLTATMVATVGEVAGRVIGEARDLWTIDLQARAPTKAQSVKTIWADFADERNPHLHPLRLDPWAVEAVGDMPVLYLNRGFEGLESLLRSNRVADRPVRDAIAAQIAADVWTTLFNAAVYAVHVEDGRPQWPGGWHEAALRRMLPDAFPNHSADDALVEIVSRRRVGDGGDLQTRILHAATRQGRIPRNLAGLLRTLRSTGQEDE